MNCEKKDMLLYAITDRSWLNGRSLKEVVKESLDGGVTFLQIREKHLEEADFIREACEIKALCDKYRVPFIINDSVDIALKVGADGVHVGQDDMELCLAREMLGPDKIIGVSAHSVSEAVAAEKNGADYLGVGAVFATSSKDNASKLDHKVLREICKAVSIPVVAIGGINEDNILQLSGCGIDGVAVISAVYAQADIEAATKKLKERAKQVVNS